MIWSKTICEYNLFHIVFLKIYLAKSQTKWKNVICVISQINFISGSNPKFIRTGFFVVKNVGISFLNIIIIPMVVQESQIDKKSSDINFKTNKVRRNLESN